MSIGDLWGDAVDAAKTMLASNPAQVAANVVARTPEEAFPWISIQTTVAAEAVEQALNDTFVWDLSPAQVVPNVADKVMDVGKWGWDHRGGFGSTADWIERLMGLFTNKWTWVLLALVLALVLLTPLARAGYRVTEKPRTAYRSVRMTYRRGFKGNVKHAAKWWVDPKTKQNVRQRMSIPNGKLAAQHRHGTFAIVEYRNPPAPLKPRAVGIKATDPKSARRCLVRNFGPGWRPERLDQSGGDLALYHYVRKAS